MDHTVHIVRVNHTVHTVHRDHAAAHTARTTNTAHHLSNNLLRVCPKRLHPLHTLRTQVIGRVLADEESVPSRRGVDGAVAVGWGRGSFHPARVDRHAEAADQRPVRVSGR